MLAVLRARTTHSPVRGQRSERKHQLDRQQPARAQYPGALAGGKRSALQPAREQLCWLGFAVPGRRSWDGRFQCNCPGACSTAPKLIAVRDDKTGTSSTFHSNSMPAGSPPSRARLACLRRRKSVWVNGALKPPCAATGKRLGPRHEVRPAPLAAERTLLACTAELE